MEAFKIPGPFGPDVPFSKMHVWQWAKTQPRRNVEISAYLQAIGFVMGSDRLTESDYDTLYHAIDHFHRVAPHYPDPLTFAQAFTQSPDASGFHVVRKPGCYALAPMLHEALQTAGWIYDIEPETTYFEIVNGILWARYQQIFGSRALAQIVGG